MEYGVGITGLSELLGIVAVTLSVGAAAFYVQRLKGPRLQHRRHI
jgi:hypothetical protein